MPKVTLLGHAWRTYCFVFRTGTYRFQAGKPVEVPISVALELGKKRDGRRPRFLVEEMPAVMPVINHVQPPRASAVQNVCSGPRQLRFGLWL